MRHLTQHKFHFVGIGGIGMCGLAELLFNMGASVTGSDLGENANTLRLRDMGIQVFKGHSAHNIGDVDVLVYSSAVKDENVELQEARKRKIPIIPRAEALAEIMRLKRGIAVAGTHGKTTTTSLAAAIFLSAHYEPTIVVGGRLDLIQSTARLGTGDWMIAEADESDGSFHKLSPEIAIITNIDNDHLDHYKNFENLKKAFYDFALRVPFFGAVIACGDDTVIRKVFENFSKKIIYYGFSDTNDYHIQGSHGQYQMSYHGKKIGEYMVSVPGRHNALNSAAAMIAGLSAGISFEDAKLGLLTFRGVDRRFQYKGRSRGVEIYDDYGHHPTEVIATLQAFREKFPKNRLVVYFQPHRYSRTRDCWQEFISCFKECDALLITDIYAAGESPIDGIDSPTLAQAVQHPNCRYMARLDSSVGSLFSILKEGDIFLTLGAGDGWKVAESLVNAN